MLRLTVVAVLVAVAAAMEWEDYKKAYGKVYELEEDLRRQQIYKANLADIEAHNAKADRGESSFRMGVNQFADMTGEELQRLKGLRGAGRPSSAPVLQAPASTDGLPSSVDWRTQGYVTPVKDQDFPLGCGSCWAFSATGSLEGQHFRKTGKLVSLSEQNLVDCSKNGDNDGCEGGFFTDAFDYIKKNHGIDTEAAYPYEARDGQCRFKKAGVGATLGGYVFMNSGGEDALKWAVAIVGPVSVAMDANHTSFDHYESGVYTEADCSTTDLDHAVLVVGYGTTEDGLDYWLVKNSWGTSWGNEGYMKIARNKNNMCGIATFAAFPIV